LFAAAACGIHSLYEIGAILHDTLECMEKADKAKKEIDECPVTDPQRADKIRSNVAHECLTDALKSNVIGLTFDAACLVGIGLCFASAGSPI
jgi:hypothetical protein